MNRSRILHNLAAALTMGAVVAGAAEPKIIALPPFLVEEPAQPLPWRHAEVAGWEVLSTCPERLTRALIANHHRLQELLAELLPPSLQLKMSGGHTLIFVDSAHQPPSSREVVARMALTAAEQDKLDAAIEPIDDGRLRRRPPPPRYAFLPNLRLWDRDGSVLFAVVEESKFDPNRVALTADYVGYILQQRLPALPPWFISGVLTLFSRSEFTERELTLGPLDWPLEIGSAALLPGPESNRALLPLAEFFAGDLSSADTGTDRAMSLWQAQAALFVHWGVAGRGAPRREALGKFVERAAVEPLTEALFQECFGLDFATAQAQLTAHLPEAQSERLELRPERTRLPDYTLRPATDVEIARLKGDWERLEISYVKAQFPVLTSKYAEQARRTLMRAYDRGHRDPRLLAVIGLCEVDAGDDAAARRFLEEAAAGGEILRPRAAFELARLRFAALRGPGSDTGARLGTAQLDEVLAPLLAARAQQPPLAEVYELIADVWTASSQQPTSTQLAVLEEGVRLFPHHSELVSRTAELSLRHGFTDTARWLINLGLTLAPDEAQRTRFEALQARIKESNPPNRE